MKAKISAPPTLHDVAARAGVSLATAGNVLRGPSKNGRILFSGETAERVRNAAIELGYSPNRSARAMRTRRSGVVGFVSVNFSARSKAVENFPVYPFLVGLNHELAPTGRHIALIELDEFELRERKRLPEALQEQFFDGLVVQFGLSSRALHLLEEFDVPLIYWDSGIKQAANCISRDESQIGRAVTQRLIELGHRKIAFSTGGSWGLYQSGEPIHFSFAARYESYEQTMRENRLTPLILQGYEADPLAEQIKSQALSAAVVQSGSLDYVAVLRALLRLGKKAPEEFSMMACDVESSVLGRGENPGGARYNRYEAGRTAAEMLLTRLGTNAQPVPSVCIPFELYDGPMAGRCPDVLKNQKKPQSQK